MHEENWNKFPKIALGDKVRVTWDQTYYDQQEIGEAILRESDSQLVVKFNDKEQTEQTPDQLRNNPNIVRTEIYIEPKTDQKGEFQKQLVGRLIKASQMINHQSRKSIGDTIIVSDIFLSRLDETNDGDIKIIADFFGISTDTMISAIQQARENLKK